MANICSPKPCVKTNQPTYFTQGTSSHTCHSISSFIVNTADNNGVRCGICDWILWYSSEVGLLEDSDRPARSHWIDPQVYL